MSLRVGRRGALIAGFAALVGCRSQERRGGGALRVVSISPSTTEAVFALGAGGLVVGRSIDCDYPPEALRLPTVGGYGNPSIEAIVALQPTLVVGARGPAGPVLESALKARGIETFFPETESMAQILDMVSRLGDRLGHAADAERITSAIRSRVDAIAAAALGRAPVRAVALFDVAPIVVAGPGSFPDELVRLAGGKNLIERGGTYPTIGIEQLVALAPDVLLDGTMDAHEPGARGIRALEDAPGWREIAALRRGRVRPLSSTALRPGPRIGEGLELLARALREDLPPGPASHPTGTP